MRRLNTSSLLLFLVVAGCGFPNHAERKYMAKIYGSSPDIRVPRSQFDTAWSRAKWFVSTYSSLPIEVMNDSLIATDTPRFSAKGYGYRVAARPASDGMLVSAQCLEGIGWPYRIWGPLKPGGGGEIRNSEILADYIKTGSLPYPELISK